MITSDPSRSACNPPLTSMTYPCPSVTTLVPLDTQQMKYLIDAMWSLTEKDANAICESHGVDDWSLESHLQTCLLNALNELN